MDASTDTAPAPVEAAPPPAAAAPTARRLPRHLDSVLIWGSQAAFVLAFLTWALELPRHGLAVPLDTRGDCMHHLVIARDLLDSGWWWTNARLSAPLGADFRLFPVAGLLDSCLYWLVSRFASTPGAVITGFWLLSFVLTAWSGAWSLRRLDVSRPTSWAVGILFAFIPHAFGRELAHLMLVSYFVPPLGALAILALRGRLETLQRSDRIIFGLACLGVGLDYVYTAFFSCFLLLVAGLGAWLGGHGRRALRGPGLAMALVIGGAGLAGAPTWFAWKKDPEAKATITRKEIAEAEHYGLKIRTLLLPIAGHPLAAFRDVEKKFTDAHFPLDNENGFERLGLTGAIGFLVLLGALLMELARRSPSGPSALAAPAALNLAAVVLGTIGGLGVVFNTLITPDVRCYNRIAVFIAFFSLFAAATLFDRALDRLPRTPLRRFFVPGAAVVLAILGSFDQVDYPQMRQYSAMARADSAVLTPFIAQLEARLPRGAMVYQLPYLPYPHTPMYRARTHQQMAPYVFSTHLRWSNGALSTEAVRFNQNLSAQPLPELVRTLRSAGFRGIWIDGYAYGDRGQGVLNALAQVGYGNAQHSSDGMFAFVDLGSGAAAGPGGGP